MIEKLKKIKGRREVLTDANMLMLISIVIFILLYAFGCVNLADKNFDKPKYFIDLLNNNAYLIIIACSLTVVMIGGGINISVGGVIGLSAMSCALLLNKLNQAPGDFDIWLTLALALGLGLAFGLLEGFLVSYLEIQPFIVTLAGMVLARGLMTTQSVKQTIVHAGFKEFVKHKIELPALSHINNNGNKIIPKLEYGAVIALAVVVLMYLFLRFTRKGRGIYAIGGNQQSALMLGINVRSTRFLSYIISGMLSGLAGFVCIMHTTSVNTSLALRSEMDAIAASIIGGTLLSGGVGNVFGSFFGVMILASIQGIIYLSDLKESYWQDMASGAMLGLFIVLQSLVLRLRSHAGLRLHGRWKARLHRQTSRE